MSVPWGMEGVTTRHHATELSHVANRGSRTRPALRWRLLFTLTLLVVGCGDTRSPYDAAMMPEPDASVLPREDASVRFDATAATDASEGPGLGCYELPLNDNCVCHSGPPLPNPISSCDEDRFAPTDTLCCAQAGFPEAATCTCFLWGCNRLVADNTSCECGGGAIRSGIPHASCSPGTPEHICCAGYGGSCDCRRDGAGEGCGADRVQVPRCDITTALCGVPGVPADFPERRSSCSD